MVNRSVYINESLFVFVVRKKRYIYIRRCNLLLRFDPNMLLCLFLHLIRASSCLSVVVTFAVVVDVQLSLWYFGNVTVLAILVFKHIKFTCSL